MIFDADNFKDNIEYCRYVWQKNDELNLELNSNIEIQYIANKYLDEVCSRRGFDEDEVFEDDNLLISIVEKNVKKLSKFKNTHREPSFSTDLTPEESDKFEKIRNNHGGNDIESYDDHGLDEDESSISLN